MLPNLSGQLCCNLWVFGGGGGGETSFRATQFSVGTFGSRIEGQFGVLALNAAQKLVSIEGLQSNKVRMFWADGQQHGILFPKAKIVWSLGTDSTKGTS